MTLTKEQLKNFEARLKAEKTEIETILSRIAKRDPKVTGDWDAVFPSMEHAPSGSSGVLEESAAEVEEYESRLASEHTLELRLRDVEAALERMKTGTYGICTNCKKEIPLERLEANPEAAVCLACKP